uniref:Cystatin domain-containing protein n=1 Tax=Cacopsylla melanoneura TaxID=428564 RepID=A0A8D9AGW6_9HEMI
MLENRHYCWLQIISVGSALLLSSSLVSSKSKSGAPRPLDITGLVDEDTTTMNALKFGVDYITNGSAGEYRLGVAKILSASIQVISGINYRFKIQVVGTKCKKNMDIYNCTLPQLEADYENATDFSDVRDQRFTKSGELITDTTEEPTTEETDPREDPDFNECDVTVWDQRWRIPRYIVTHLKCETPTANEIEETREL